MVKYNSSLAHAPINSFATSPLRGYVRISNANQMLLVINNYFS